MNDEIIIEDTGYLMNVTDSKVRARHLKLILFPTHLRMEDIEAGTLYKDIPIDKINSIKANNIFVVFLNPLTQGTNFKITTDDIAYRISFKNIGGIGIIYNVLTGTKRAKLWANKFQALKTKK